MKRFPVLSLCLVASGLAAASALLCAVPAEAQTLNNAFGGLSESSNEPIDVKSDVLTVYTDEYILFSGNVKAVQGTTTLRARELKVHYRGEGNGAGAEAESAEQPAVGGGVVPPATGGSVAPTTASSPGPTTPNSDEGAPASSNKPPAEAAGEDNTQRTIEDPIDIQSDWLLVHDKEKYAHFKGNVRVVRGDTKLRSEELKVNYSGGDSLAATTEASARRRPRRALARPLRSRRSWRGVVFMRCSGRGQRRIPKRPSGRPKPPARAPRSPTLGLKVRRRQPADPWWRIMVRRSRKAPRQRRAKKGKSPG